MSEFWVASGHHLTRRRADGRLAVTGELLTAWLARPELVPPQEACDAERALHAALIADPLRVVDADELGALADADARENWDFFLRLRDLLTRAGSIEDAFVAFALAGRNDLPPLFVSQLAHLVLRNALEGCGDPFVLRAGELFYRAQRASVHAGSLKLADLELVEEREREQQRLAHASPLGAMLAGGDDLDVMDEENAWTYWSRSDANSMVMNIGGSTHAREGFAGAIAAWIGHLAGIEAKVTPVAEIDDPDWRWFAGLDAEGTRIGNAAWRGEAFDGARIAALLRAEFAASDRLDPRLGGRPAYFILGMTAEGVVRMKPQNLVAGLPVLWPRQAALEGA